MPPVRTPPARSAGPTLPKMLLRGALLKCPQCGSRRTFLRSWFGRHDRCRTCGIRWRREEGFELGALTMNTILTFATVTIVMVAVIVATLPDIPAVGLVAALTGIAVLMPIAIYPFTYTLWLAFDLRVHPPDAAELAEARAAVSGAAVVGDPATEPAP